MDRRSFFRRAAGKATQTAVKEAEKKVQARASKWIRPPYALDELEFLLACTRCDECVAACPHDVIFKLPSRLGAQFVNTPAMDLLNKGCHLCEDWPCVGVCEPGALIIPEMDEDQEEKAPLPRLAQASVNTKTCLPYTGPECGACRDSCPVPGAMIWELEKPVIDMQYCVGCGLCLEVCILEPKAISIQSLYSDAESAQA